MDSHDFPTLVALAMDPSRTYLVVEPSPTLRRRLVTTLGALGVHEANVRTAGDGEEAVRLFFERADPVVFLDIELPRLDGLEAARAILRIDPDVRVVLVTALERSDARVRQLLADGAYELLAKPVRTEDVRRVLEQVERDLNPTVRRIR